jgi:hypothetical protein
MKKICLNAINVRVQNLIKKGKNAKNAMEPEKFLCHFSKISNLLSMKKLRHFVLPK